MRPTVIPILLWQLIIDRFYKSFLHSDDDIFVVRQIAQSKRLLLSRVASPTHQVLLVRFKYHEDSLDTLARLYLLR